jgi:DNA-binding NarL/FixJ family response regulator
LAAGLAKVIENQEKILKNQGKMIPPPKRKRKKSLTNASGWTAVKAEEKAEFLEMFERGLSVTEIANATGRTTSTVSNWLHKLGAGDEATETQGE